MPRYVMHLHFNAPDDQTADEYFHEVATFARAHHGPVIGFLDGDVDRTGDDLEPQGPG